ncbi:1-deoxy-D-xylulose-5-phosphate synthase [Nocardia terpenica]|uniref:1-deoxy-D-xylulose-5-phosphate synthase n=1 Tax=Nocardia terpenica TaxID=455432 RepID=UPI0018E09B70
MLERLRHPDDLRQVPPVLLPVLAEQIRQLIIDVVTDVGGHLGPNLGVVELTIALHRVFRSPHDTLLFDTGHQAYAHKLLTGRRTAFARSLRQAGGLSGYPSRSESVHDVIENSHASTALGYADGIAKAHALTGRADRCVVAVVGDGALTGGMAYEALNNIGAAPQRPVIIVLNDNGYSYSPTVGAIASHLAHLRASTPGRQVMPGTTTYRIAPTANIFEQLGLSYLGPVNGHDIGAVEAALRQAKRLARPVFVHVVTVKGMGFPPAVDDVEKLHTASPRGTGHGAPATWTKVFAAQLADIASRRRDVVAVTAAMLGPTGLRAFAEQFPDRCYDVGIAEQHAVASAAGLATAGLHPVVALYSTFLNRAFDQLIMDVALHRLPVTFVLDRAGITGPDGPSHHGIWDLSLLGTVPGMEVAAPRDARQLQELLVEAIGHDCGPTALRFPKASVGAVIPALERVGPVDILAGPAEPDILLVSIGPLAAECIEASRTLAAKGIGITVVDPRWVLPIPEELLALARSHHCVITVEDNARSNGVGTALSQALTETGCRVPTYHLGLPRRFLSHGKRTDMLAEAGLSASGIVQAALDAWADTRAGNQETPS